MGKFLHEIIVQRGTHPQQRMVKSVVIHAAEQIAQHPPAVEPAQMFRFLLHRRQIGKGIHIGQRSHPLTVFSPTSKGTGLKI
jgi:hypothetical protein